MRFSECLRVIVSPILAYFIISLYLNCEGFEVWEFSVLSAVLHLHNNNLLARNSIAPLKIHYKKYSHQTELASQACSHSQHISDESGIDTTY